MNRVSLIKRNIKRRKESEKGIRFYTTEKQWQWAYAHSNDKDLTQSITKCCIEIKKQLNNNPYDLIFIFATNYKSTKELLNIIENNGFDKKLVFGCTSNFGLFQGNIPQILHKKYEETQETSFSMTVASLPGVEVIPFHVGSEKLPVNKNLNWMELQRKLPKDKSSLLMLIVKKFCFKEKKFFKILDNAFPFTPKVGALLGSISHSAENIIHYNYDDDNDHVNTSDDNNINNDNSNDNDKDKEEEPFEFERISITKNREVLFVCGERYLHGAIGVYLRGDFDIQSTFSHSFEPFSEKKIITEIKDDQIISLDSQYVWEYFDFVCEKTMRWKDPLFRQTLFARIESNDKNNDNNNLNEGGSSPSNILPVSWDFYRKSGIIIGHFNQIISKGDLLQFYIGKYKIDERNDLFDQLNHINIANTEKKKTNFGIFCFSSEINPTTTHEYFLNDYPVGDDENNQNFMEEQMLFTHSELNQKPIVRAIYVQSDMMKIKNVEEELSREKKIKETLLDQAKIDDETTDEIIPQDIGDTVIFTTSSFSQSNKKTSVDVNNSQPQENDSQLKCTGLFSAGSIFSDLNLNSRTSTKPSLLSTLLLFLVQKKSSK